MERGWRRRSSRRHLESHPLTYRRLSSNGGWSNRTDYGMPFVGIGFDAQLPQAWGGPPTVAV